jgi:YggT family protein
MATLTKLVSLVLYVYVFSIFILVIISWVSPTGYNPIAALLYSITEPVMRPARRLIPPISGIDLSPMAVLIALYLLRMLIIPPLLQLTLKAGFPPAALGLI